MRKEINIIAGSGFMDMNFQNYQEDDKGKRDLLADLAQASFLVRSHWKEMVDDGMSYTTKGDKALHLKLLKEELDELLDEWNQVMADNEDEVEQE